MKKIHLCLFWYAALFKKYNKKVFEIINKIRLNSAEYSKFVLDNISNIKIENQEILNPNTEMKEYKQIIVFKKK